MCVKSVLNPIPRTQHRPICVTVNPVLVSRPTAFRRRFNLRKANWSGYATDVDILIDEVDPTPENYERFVEVIRVTSRKHIPRGCRSHYIPGLSEESKSLYEAYKKQYMSNPFDSTTLDTGNELISKMAAENKKRWEEMITSTDLTGNSRRHGRQSEISLTTPQLQNHLVWSLLTKLHTNCSSTAEERCQQSRSVLNYPQLVKMTPHWYSPSLKKSTRRA